ncbi:MAG: GNAT family protein [Mycoplasmatota bacterium]
MNLIGTKKIATSRLELRVPTMVEQKHLWEILMIPSVNKYYLSVPKKFKDNLVDWEIQKPFYENKITNALDKDKFEWSIFLKDSDVCIGQINAQVNERCNVGEKNIGWYIDPLYQGNGYCKEAAKAMFDYLFLEVDIDGLVTGAAICNPSSWKIMEYFGLNRLDQTHDAHYTFVDEVISVYEYVITKDDYLSKFID